MDIQYQIEFFSRWHAGSGLSGSTYADALVIKDPAGLPYIPGKTLKGLLRDAAESLRELDPDRISKDFVLQVFGNRTDQENSRDTERSTMDTEGICHFSSARLDARTASAIPAEQTGLLYQVQASTRIDNNGLADNKTLRQREVCIPVTLFAGVYGFPEEENAREQFEQCLKWIKRLGGGRNRGLGRCQFSLLK